MGASGGKPNIQNEVILKQYQSKEPENLIKFTSQIKCPLHLIKDNSKVIVTTKTLLMIISKKLMSLKNKKLADILNKKNELIELIRSNQLESAKFKTEYLIRDEELVKTYEIISIICISTIEIIYSVFYNLVNNQQEFDINNKFTKIKKSTKFIVLPPQDSRHYIDTIIYCSTRINIDEFNSLKEIFIDNFGNFYVQNAASNAYGHVKEEIVRTLSLYNYTNYQILERLNYLAEEEKIHVNFTQNYENNFTINSHIHE